MLSFLLIILFAVHLTSAKDFLDNCPLDPTQKVDDDLVVDVLQTFYKDLTDLRAIKELWRMTKADEKCTDEHTIEGRNVLSNINLSNIHVDRDYGIKRSPNLTLLSEVPA